VPASSRPEAKNFTFTSTPMSPGRSAQAAHARERAAGYGGYVLAIAGAGGLCAGGRCADSRRLRRCRSADPAASTRREKDDEDDGRQMHTSDDEEDQAAPPPPPQAAPAAASGGLFGKPAGAPTVSFSSLQPPNSRPGLAGPRMGAAAAAHVPVDIRIRSRE
jgi:hypothetical protein